MINERVAGLLNQQIGHEFSASQGYLAIAAYFGLQSLDRWADLFYKQSEEERQHAMKIVRFLVDVDAPITLPQVAESKAEFASGLAAVEWALQNERAVTKQFHTMAAVAMEEKDFTSFQFLQWFIEEQVEEEASMEKLIAIIKSESNLFRAEELLSDAHEEC